jgi:hypothetical protein
MTPERRHVRTILRSPSPDFEILPKSQPLSSPPLTPLSPYCNTLNSLCGISNATRLPLVRDLSDNPPTSPSPPSPPRARSSQSSISITSVNSSALDRDERPAKRRAGEVTPPVRLSSSNAMSRIVGVEIPVRNHASVQASRIPSKLPRPTNVQYTSPLRIARPPSPARCRVPVRAAAPLDAPSDINSISSIQRLQSRQTPKISRVAEPVIVMKSSSASRESKMMGLTPPKFLGILTRMSGGPPGEHCCKRLYHVSRTLRIWSADFFLSSLTRASSRHA